MTRLREKPILTQRSIDDLKRESEELVDSAKALYPDLPIANLIEKLVELADPEYLEQLDSALRAAHFRRIIRARAMAKLKSEREAAWLFPEIRQAVLVLPTNIPIAKDKTVPREKIHYSDTTRYLKILDREDKGKLRHSPKRLAIMAIRKLWPRNKRARRMTLGEVDALKATEKKDPIV